MQTVTAKQLHLETESVLDQLERGDHMLVTRKGRVVARLEPIKEADSTAWDEIMADVWSAQAKIKSEERTANPVLEERKRRRR